MKCPKCSNKMVELFTSWACDHCDGKSGWTGDTTPRPWPAAQFAVGDLVELTVLLQGWHTGFGVVWEVVSIGKAITLCGTGADAALGVWVPLANAHTLRKV